MHPYLELLRQVEFATSQVQAAARAGDWEQVHAGLVQRQQLMAAMDAAGQAGLAPAERAEATAIFEGIQVADTQAHAALAAAHQQTGAELNRLNQGRQALAGYRRGLAPPAGPQQLDEQG